MVYYSGNNDGHVFVLVEQLYHKKTKLTEFVSTYKQYLNAYDEIHSYWETISRYPRTTMISSFDKAVAKDNGIGLGKLVDCVTFSLDKNTRKVYKIFECKLHY